ncbi:sugar ABC transporter substrate-binding protein [Variovorax sp. J22R133]|uniref:sugar ABC transporter substrate-binding protein n=1 Tax=Variovorax brevis TaxID=3053503 RepID=UPI002575EA4E|nr:sugar ABC transporter substrate-binding protein [Variovorax sp. J22R133]MDM0116461.1 sugar ABC transporter substrate-binding protein [Variovorax sp. J22R133]
MAFIKNFIDQQTARRRDFLLASAYGLVGIGAATNPLAAFAQQQGKPAVAWSYRDRNNPYWHAIASGGESFVESVGMKKSDMVHLLNNGSSQKSLSDIQAFLSKTGGKAAIACDANDAPNCRPIVEAVRKAGAFVSTIWNKPDDLHPWDFGDAWVSHMTWSDEGPAEQTARTLFTAMGGKGAIVGVGGIAANNPAIERFNGMKKALKDFPGIQLLDYQPGDWSTQKANQVMEGFLTRFGTKIGGVFCANDSMAYGVLEALKADGRKLPVVGYDGSPEAVDLVVKGDLLTTVFTNPHWGGGITAALAYYAAIGKFKPSAEPKEHREFYGPSIMITQKDAAEFKKKYISSTPKYDWTDFWGTSGGQIKYGARA